MKATARAAGRRWSVRVTTVAGIDIRVHASMLLLVWLVVIASAGQPGGEWEALLWLGFLFGSVLLHELAHSLVALHVGVGVREIELLPIGGVSKMDRIPDRPAYETAIAAAGPLTSVAVGLAALGSAFVVRSEVWPPDVYSGALLQRLGWLNLLLAGFNLLPALPLDGGRVFRALIEPRVGPTEATRIAARVGRSFAVGMIAFGVVINIWLIFIGVFVYVASESEEAGSVIHARLGKLRAADVMVHDPLVVSPLTPVDDIAHLLPTTAQRQFPVVDQGTYVGIVDAGALAPPATVAGDAMDATPPVGVDTPLDELALVDPRAGRAVAVVSDSAVVGLVQLDDVQRLARQALRSVRS